MTSDDAQQSEPSEAVGQQLKRAREKLGLSIAQIAGAQHLRNGIIQAIENGDYGQIDSELFLKGYIRAYAKQVGLDSDAIIADLNRELEPARIQKARELESNPLITIERRRRRKRRIAKLLLLIVALLLAAALVVHFVMPKFSPDEEGAGEPPAMESLPEVEKPQPENEPVLSVDPDAEIAEEEQHSLDLQAPEVVASEPVPVDVPETEALMPVEEESVEAFDPEPSAGMLEIAFTGDCWVQVRDANGKRLANSLQRAGDTLQVSGEAPLQVIIGAVSTVETIRFQGETVDIREYPVVNNRSEFTLTI